MKKLLIIIFTFLFSFHTKAQYNSFISENKIWVESSYHEDNDVIGIGAGESWRWIAYFQGDTLLDSIIYSKMYLENFYHSYYENSQYPIIVKEWGERSLYKLVREDTISKQVWIRNGNDEKLIFDFDAVVGDTLVGNIGTIFIVDSTSLFNNRKKIFVSSENDNGYFIEGIGGVNGIFSMSHETKFDGDASGSIICYSEDSVIIYGECELETLEVNESLLGKSKSVIYPNPTNGVFSIESSEVIQQILIFNSIGKLVKQVDDSNKIDLSSCPKGIYTIEIQSPKGYQYSKIVIN